MTGSRQVEKNAVGSATSSQPRRCAWLGPIVVPAVLLCALNALKPVAMDDAAYLQYARQIRVAPHDPYGFEVNWYQHPQPANTILAPPVLLYWLAFGIRTFGDNELTLKLWLLPWCILLTAAAYRILRRYARPIAAPATWMLTLSPAILPGLNLMLDVPCLALSLASLAVFGCQRSGMRTAVLAGLLASLAAQTKYTGLLAPAVLVLAAAFERRPRRALRRALFALLIVVAVFVAWELFVAMRYGQSHFLFHALNNPAGRSHRWLLFWPLIGLLGGVATPAAVLGLCSFRRPILWTVLAIAIIAAGYLLIAFVPRFDQSAWTPTATVFGIFGTASIAIVGSLAVGDRSRRGRFLAAWLTLEVVGYFTLSPWPAVRRVIGIVVVATVIAARAAARNNAPSLSVWLAAAFGITLGVVYLVIDIENARVERDAVSAIAARLREHEAGSRVWFVGHLSWQHYAEQAGWLALDPDVTVLEIGDWLVVPRRELAVQRIEIPEVAERAESFAFSSLFALGTNPWYYGANSALRKREDPLLRVDLYRIRARCRVPSAAAQSNN